MSSEKIEKRILDISIDYDVKLDFVQGIFLHLMQFLSNEEEALAKTRLEVEKHSNKEYDNTKKGDDLNLNLQICGMCVVTTLVNFVYGKPIEVKKGTWKEELLPINDFVVSGFTWEDVVLLSAIYTVLNYKLQCEKGVVDTDANVEINADEVYHVLLPEMPLQSKKERGCYLTREEFIKKANATIAKFKKVSGKYIASNNCKPYIDEEVDEDFYFYTEKGFDSVGDGNFKVSKCQEIAVKENRMNTLVLRVFLTRGKQPHNTWLDMLAKTYIVFHSIVNTKSKAIDIVKMGQEIGVRSEFDGSFKSKRMIKRILDELNNKKNKQGKSYNCGFKLVGKKITWEIKTKEA